MREDIPYKTTDLTKNRVLVLAAHADDEILGCGGSLIKHIKAKDPVKIIIFTDDISKVNQERRKKEAIRALRLIKIKDISWLGFKDGRLNDHLAIDSLRRGIDSFSPTLIYLPSQEEIHPDHLTLAEATKQVYKQLKNKSTLAYYEISAPLKPNVLVDITKEIDLKLKALRCYTSQLAQNDYLEKIKGLNRYRTYTLPKNIKYAEAFRIVS
jgi:LmbE family N-acetylglucosaminyl deacetylase